MTTHILLYHALDAAAHPPPFDDACDMSVVVNVDDFRAQLACLAAIGKRVVSLEDALFPTNGQLHQNGNVALTFDDGHESNYRLAFPLLQEVGFAATFYVVGGFVDQDPNYVTSAQLREMAKSGMTIGSHTMTHRWLPTLNSTEVRRELADSKARLEDLLQQSVLDFALPGGHYSPAILNAIRDSGYRSVATSKAGAHTVGDTAICFNRIEIRRDLSTVHFQDRFRSSTLMKLRLLEAGKDCLRRACGLERYTRMRRFAHSILR